LSGEELFRSVGSDYVVQLGERTRSLVGDGFAEAIELALGFFNGDCRHGSPESLGGEVD
jgi:hypothetical protein